MSVEDAAQIFLSTPSARRATVAVLIAPMKANDISIHALREEGDLYELRRENRQYKRFLSTPSARRATDCLCKQLLSWQYFYPRPPRGGRPASTNSATEASTISIHALREEGDAVVRNALWRS